jgi:hypothetical protein
MKIAAVLFKICLLSGLNVDLACAQSFLPYNLRIDRYAREVMQDNELERSNAVRSDDVYLCNPLLLNGGILDYGNFTLSSTGELSLIKKEPGSSRSIEISFYIRLRRSGEILEAKDDNILNKAFHKIEVSKIMALAQPGDQLIIDPVEKEDWSAKRILMLIPDHRYQ